MLKALVVKAAGRVETRMLKAVKWLTGAVTACLAVLTVQPSSITDSLASSSHLAITRFSSLTPAGSSSVSYLKVRITGGSKVAPSGPSHRSNQQHWYLPAGLVDRLPQSWLSS